MSITFDEVRDEGPEHRPGPTRRRWAAVVGAAMLVAAAGGVGYGIGRGAATDADAGSLAAPLVTDPETVQGPTTTAITDEESGQESPGRGDAETTTSTMVIDVTDDGTDVVASGSYGYGYGSWIGAPLELLFERTTDSGFTLRAQLGQTWEDDQGVGWEPGGWTPAPWCFPAGEMRIALAGNGVIDVGGTGWFREAFQGRAVSWLTLGGADDRPQWVVVVQAPADVIEVAVTFADGTRDSVAPQNGVALLTAPGTPAVEVAEDGFSWWMTEPPVFELTFTGAEPFTMSSDSVGQWNTPEFVESCEPPPPALPEPGEQPADAAAAELEIRSAMTELYGVIGSGAEGSDLIDDPTGVAEAREQVQAGGFAEDAAGAVATVDELVFTAPDEAWFRYSIDTPGNDFRNRYGIAVLIGGVWKITRSTVCQDLSLAGGDCGAGWEPIQPPSVRVIESRD